MPSLISQLRTYLLADASIAAAVGVRVRPRRLAQGETLPAIRLNTIVGDADEHLQGFGSLAHALIQIDCYGATSEAADALDELVRARLDGLRGAMGAIFVTGVSMVQGPRQSEEPVDDGDGNSWRYGSGRDYRFSFTV